MSGTDIYDGGFLTQIDPGYAVLAFVRPALEAFRSETVAPDLSLAMVLSAIILSAVYWFSVVRPALKALAIRIRFMRMCRTSQIFIDNLYHFDLSMREVKFLEHGWSKFLESCLLRDPHVQCSIEITERPANFINLREAEHFGLTVRWFGALSGIYVGVGLLFTFIGLVAALYFSSAAIQAVVQGGADGAGADRGAEVQRALAQLLNTATFKFMTSIAGLGCSIALAIFDRRCRARLDYAFDSLCSELERCSVRITPEFLADRQYQVMVEIARRLKGMAEGPGRLALSARTGEAVPREGSGGVDVLGALARIEANFGTAVAALTETVQRAVLPQAAVPTPTLEPIAPAPAYQQEMISALAMLGTRIEAVAGRLEASVDASTRAIAASIQTAMDASLAPTLAKAVESGVNAVRMAPPPPPPPPPRDDESRLVAGTEALLRIETAVQACAAAMAGLSRHMAATDAGSGHLGREVAALAQHLGQAMQANTQAMRDALTEHMDRLSQEQRSAATDQDSANQESAGQLEQAGLKAAGQVADGAGQVLARVGGLIDTLGGPMDRLCRTLESVDGRIGAHLSAFEQLTKAVQESETAMAGSATALSAASAPLTRVGDSLSEAMTTMTGAVGKAAEGISDSQRAGVRLADELRTTLEALKAVWTLHESRFNDVDQSVTRILAAIIGHAEAHGEALRDHVVAIDTHLAHTVSTLAANIDSLQEMVADMTVAAKSLERAGTAMAGREMAPGG